MKFINNLANIIKNNKQKSIIIGIIILVIATILIISTMSIIDIINKKAKQVAKDIENINEETIGEVDLDDEVLNVEDISELENIVFEENTIENSTTDKTNKNTSNSSTYYIKVNYGAQVTTIYKKDSDGNYTVPVKAMVCSTGIATPKSGVYKIPYKYRWLGLQGDVYGQYCTQVVGNILFHSVPYLRRGDPGSLEYWEYDKLGTYASAGCIRLTVQDAMWIYNNCSKGTQVEFYSSSNPGPLGKPSAKKISNAEGDLKNWDPTDPDSNNPWRNNNNNNSNDNPNNNKPQINNTVKNEVVNNIEQNNVTNDNNTNNTNTVENDVTTNNTTNNNKNNNTTNTIKKNEIENDMTSNQI